jgi:hypothetical protein
MAADALAMVKARTPASITAPNIVLLIVISILGAFRKHYLTNERNMSEHRLGFPNVEGEVIGPFGEVHTASPVKRIPTAESRQFADEPHNGESIGVTVSRRTPI